MWCTRKLKREGAGKRLQGLTKTRVLVKGLKSSTSYEFQVEATVTSSAVSRHHKTSFSSIVTSAISLGVGGTASLTLMLPSAIGRAQEEYIQGHRDIDYVFSAS